MYRVRALGDGVKVATYNDGDKGISELAEGASIANWWRDERA